MASFRYSFQKVVDLKASEKMQAEWLLSSAVGILSAEQLSLGQLQTEQQQWEQKLIDACMHAVSLQELQMMQNYVEYLKTCITNKLLDVNQAQQAVDRRREKLSDRMKDEKVWLKAKEHAHDRFRHTMQLKDQNELDELASVRFMLSAP